MAKTTTDRFNLIEEDWIPVANKGLVSLRRIFSDPKLKALGGNPIRKISILKLLLAICQAAATPKDIIEWRNLSAKGLAHKAIEYLEKWKDSFWLYGEKPFLQMPKVEAELKNYGLLMPEISDGNTTLLFQSNKEQKQSDADKAQLLIQVMGFALGGKKTDKGILIKEGRKRTDGPGPSMGNPGFLHTFILLDNIQKTLFLNTFTASEISEMKLYKKGLGAPPWEKMPTSFNDSIANNLINSYLGRLIPVSRFCLICDDGIKYARGIDHYTIYDYVFDPSMSIEVDRDKIFAIKANPAKRPWRELPAILAPLDETNNSKTTCYQIKYAINKLKDNKKLAEQIIVYCGGLCASGKTAGEQKVIKNDDYIESQISLNIADLDIFYLQFKKELLELDGLATTIKNCIGYYYKMMSGEPKKKTPTIKKYQEKASHLFWQLCEKQVDKLVEASGDGSGKKCVSLRSTFAGIAREVYNHYCPKATSRQLEAWAKNLPNLSKYLQRERIPHAGTNKE